MINKRRADAMNPEAAEEVLVPPPSPSPDRVFLLPFVLRDSLYLLFCSASFAPFSLFPLLGSSRLFLSLVVCLYLLFSFFIFLSFLPFFVSFISCFPVFEFLAFARFIPLSISCMFLSYLHQYVFVCLNMCLCVRVCFNTLVCPLNLLQRFYDILEHMLCKLYLFLSSLDTKKKMVVSSLDIFSFLLSFSCTYDLDTRGRSSSNKIY